VGTLSLGCASGNNCEKIVERFRARSSKFFIDSTTTLLCRSAGRGPAKSFYNSSTIPPLFFYNSSSFGRIWCIRIGLRKICRRNNRRRIVETFGEARPRFIFQIQPRISQKNTQIIMCLPCCIYSHGFWCIDGLISGFYWVCEYSTTNNKKKPKKNPEIYLRIHPHLVKIKIFRKIESKTPEKSKISQIKNEMPQRFQIGKK
jgi:hypothetical protein